MQVEWIEAAMIATTSVGSAVLALMVHARMTRRPAGASARSAVPAPEPAVFLFENRELVDATEPARTLLDSAPAAGSDWARLLAFVTPRFGDLEGAMGQLAQKGRVELSGAGDTRKTMRLQAEDVNGLTRITLIDAEAEGRGLMVDALSHRAFEDELEVMRKTLDRLPALAWRESQHGAIAWANRAYVLQAQAFTQEDEGLVWPLPRLFSPVEAAPGDGPRRAKLDLGDDKALWFDRFSFPLEGGSLHFALPADAAVRAERSLRSFVQTLTKTFADLPIGLAVFDRQRKLQLFNPALIELTQLATEFLSARPSLYAFLDRLREARMMPEPKDYRSWRLQMTELEQAAAAGFHSETWTLPRGQTYRVTGRPHPDGAVAFLFEDITSEVSLTRRFRAELELGQEVLDQMQEAVAVFRPSGELAMSNGAYDRLWGVEPSTSLARVTILDSVRIWQHDCASSPLWAEARGFCFKPGEKAPLTGEVSRNDGTRLSCHFTAISGGAMLVRFLPVPALAPANTDFPDREPRLTAN